MAPFAMFGKKPKVSILSSDSGSGDPFYLEKYVNSAYKAASIPPRKISDPSCPQKDSGEFEPSYLGKYVPIMERKIGSRGLSSSFSSNVGRKECAPSNTPPFLSEEETRSKVKAIVNWLENTNDEIASRRGRSCSTSQSHLNQLRTMGRHKASSAPANSKPASLSRFEAEILPEQAIEEESDQVESSFDPPVIPALSDRSAPSGPFKHGREARYSYNFLNHRQFFDNRPLMRCLDEETETNSPEGSPSQTAAAAAAAFPAADQKETDAASDQNVELSTHAICNTKVDQGSRSEVQIRNAEDVRQYWENVRIELQMRDCEGSSSGDPGDFHRGKELKPPTQTEKHCSSISSKNNDSIGKVDQHGRLDSQTSSSSVISSHHDQTGKEDDHSFRKEDGPSISFSPIGSRPSSHYFKTFDEQMADFDDFLQNDDVWANSQQKIDEMSQYRTDMYLDMLSFTRKMAAFDGFLVRWEEPETLTSGAKQDEVIARHDGVKIDDEKEKHAGRHLSDESVQIRDFAHDG